MGETNTKMAGVYGVLLLVWWGGWLALDAWRIEYLLTNVDKWEGFRRDILLCAISAMFSVLALMMHARKKTAVWSLVFTLALMLIITALIVGGSSLFIGSLIRRCFGHCISGLDWSRWVWYLS